jgi:putative hydrolase of the HAD superfamily
LIRAVFFDLFETLITEFDPNREEKIPAGTRLGLDAEVFRKEWRARRRERHTGAYNDYPEVLRDIYQAIQVEEGGLDEDMIQTLNTERLAAKAAPFSKIRDDILELLYGLRDMELVIGLITNSEPEDVAAWPESDLSPFFDDAVFSHKVGYMKPDPEIYHIACQRTCVKPRESVFVGDGGSNELGGAANIGMMPLRAAWFSVQWTQITGSELRNEKDSAYPRLATPVDLLPTLREFT